MPLQLQQKSNDVFCKKWAEQGDGPNHHALGTFVMPPADPTSRAGVMPKASGDPSSRTFAKTLTFIRGKFC